jgi:FtsH-binding integral membrane protein
MLGASAALVSVPLYRALFVAQLAFYILAVAGYVFRRSLRGVRYAMMPYYLTAMHLAFLVGFFRFVTRSNTGEWRRIP